MSKRLYIWRRIDGPDLDPDPDPTLSDIDMNLVSDTFLEAQVNLRKFKESLTCDRDITMQFELEEYQIVESVFVKNLEIKGTR